MLCQICGILEYAAKDNGHALAWGSPLLGLSGPDARPDVHWSPGDFSVAAALETAKKQLMTPIGEGTAQAKSGNFSDDDLDDNLQIQTRAALKHAVQAEQQGQGGKGAMAKDDLDILRRGRDLHDAGPAQLRGRARRFLPNQSGWPLFFAFISFLFHGNKVHNICQRGDRQSSCSSLFKAALPMPASPRHRARCDRHEARAGIVALTSCCLARLSNGGLGPLDDTALSLPACTQRSICWGAALASRLDATEHLLQIRNLSIFPCDPESWSYGRNPPEIAAKEIISARISFPCSCPNCTVTRLASRMCGARFSQS